MFYLHSVNRFCSILLCCIFSLAHQLLHALLKAPCNIPPPSHLTACIPEGLPNAARFYSHPLLSRVATNSMGHGEGVSWSPGKG